MIVLALRVVKLFRAPPGSGKAVLFLIGFFLIISLLMAAAWFFTKFEIRDTRLFIHIALTIYLFLLFWFSQKYPGFTLMARMEIEKERYRNSSLKEVNVDETISELNALMNEEKLYALEDLSLQQLARHLKIQPHQLSELLNSVLGTGFNAFINEYRVNEACELLLGDKKRPVIEIGMAVGFNSNSAFYRAFNEVKGMSPARYRTSRQSAH